MQTIKVTGCVDCPFHYTNYDDFAVGNDTLEICLLKQRMDTENKVNADYFIDCWDTKHSEDIVLKTPEWCPIKSEGVTIEKE
jgi:hypothetical protein